MYNQLKNRKTAIGLAVGIILIFVLFFRGDIARLLGLIEETSPQVESRRDKVSEATETSSVLPEDTAEKILPVVSQDTPEVPVISSFTPYTGRDPQEVNPTAEGVKLMDEESRRKFYLGIENYGAALKANPGYLHGWLQLGLLKKVIGDYIGARDAWEYAGLIEPRNTVSFSNLGELYWRYLPDFPRSEANFRTAIKNRPEDPPVYISLSDFHYYSYTAKKDLADDVLLEGIAANPGSTDLKRALAGLYERDGNIAEAIIWWQKVLEKEPENTSVAAAIEALKKKQ